MGKNYEDLSRRGLIKLDHDFDKQNNGALSKYLAKHEDEYEDIRPVEKVIDCCDTAVASIKRSISCVKASMEADDHPKGAVKVLNAVADNTDVIKGGIRVISSMMSK